MASPFVKLPVPSHPLKCVTRKIEKEMLAIVWSCNKFDQYLYGRDSVTIESDHEPVRSVFKKEVQKSPKRLQTHALALALQKYNLDV